MTKLNVTQICTALLGLTEDELKLINSETVALLNHKAKVRQFEAGKALKVGMRVKWTRDSGQTYEGIVEKINIKTVKVRTSQGLWNISPSLLSPSDSTTPIEMPKLEKVPNPFGRI